MDDMELNNTARRVRRTVLEMTHCAKSSHVGSALSIVELLVYIYGEMIDHEAPREKRDRFLFSKGHACAALYATLAEHGYIPREQLLAYATDGSPLMAHANHMVSGVELSTGSLGHALPVGTGMAYAARKCGVPVRVYVLLSDGELNEGSNWEAMMLAAHLKLGNLVAIIDRNGLQGLGPTSEVIGMDRLPERFRSFGWNVHSLRDGHDFKTIRSIFDDVSSGDRPNVIIADTIKGKGVSFMEGRLEWHYRSPNDEELVKALTEVENR